MKPVAYFCAEYALFDHTPLYAGGLGILSGDYIQEIIDQKLPVAAFGLFYHREHKHGLELSLERKTPQELGLSLVTNTDGSILKVKVPLCDREVMVQAWTYKKANMNLYLMDTQIEENKPEDWNICDTLYVDDRDLRLQQEIILGIGGMRLIKALNIQPSVYHLNEGHSAFMAFEFIRAIMKSQGKTFSEAVAHVKKRIVFTNHTLVAAGQEHFGVETMKSFFSGFCKDIGISVSDLIQLGLDAKNNLFSMTLLALTMSSKVNAVSALHGKKAREEWKGYNVESITNGIYIGRWDKLAHYSHAENKKKLIDYIKNATGTIFDEKILLLGWARRFVDYKRPLAILDDIERFKRIAKADGRKVQLVFSGPINATYTEENETMKKLEHLIETELKGIVVFIPNYNTTISQYLVSGCDVWLNTPKVGLEACGTSGMKACLNGVLPLSTSDGWMDEVDITNIGWIVHDTDITRNLLDTLEYKIVPEYYRRKDTWARKMKYARELILKRFSTERMLQEYIDKLYLPTDLINKKSE